MKDLQYCPMTLFRFFAGAAAAGEKNSMAGMNVSVFQGIGPRALVFLDRDIL